MFFNSRGRSAHSLLTSHPEDNPICCGSLRPIAWLDSTHFIGRIELSGGDSSGIVGTMEEG